MSVFDAVLLGAFGMAVLLGMLLFGVVMVWKVWPKLTELTGATRLLSESITQSMWLLKAVRDELGFIRSMSQPQQVVPPGYSVSGGDDGEYAGSAPNSQAESKGPVPFPNIIYDRYPVYETPAPKPEPDATVEDTDSSGLTQTDEDLVEAERVENLRNMGLHIEDNDTPHDAVIVDSQ